MRFALAIAALAALLFACSSNGGGDAGGILPVADTGATDGGETKLEFAAPCESSDQCKSGICYEFGDGTKGCTQKCESSGECPSGSQGRKCNNQGVCRV